MRDKQIKDTVAETLLIPLYMRAKESRRNGNRIIIDTEAQRLVDSISYDYSKFDSAKMSAIGCAVRCWFLDNVVRAFVRTHVNPVVVNVACGLDARFQRTIDKDSNLTFYSLDLPEVIKLREHFLPARHGEVYIPSSLFDTGWMKRLSATHTGSNFLFIMEGVLMYFPEKDVKELFSNLADHFHDSEVWFDACGTFVVKNSDKHDAIKKVNAKFKWGINDGKEIENWDNRLSLIKQSSQGSFFRSRYPFPMNVIGWFPKLLYKFCSIIGIKLK